MNLLKRRTFIVIVLLFFIAIQLYSLGVQDKRNHNPISRSVVAITYYPQKLVNTISNKIVYVWQGYIDLTEVHEENEILKEEINLLRQENFRISEAQVQNIRLKKLLKFRESTVYPVIAANVVGASPTNLRSQVVLVDRGIRDGVTEGMPVASYGGVVGRILLPAEKNSEVLLITDPISAIDAYIHRTRARGIVKGVGNECVMEYIENNADIGVGDKVISSGKDGFFPKGVIIGTVSEIETKGSFISARVSPHVDLNSLEEVVIILKTINSIVLNE